MLTLVVATLATVTVECHAFCGLPGTLSETQFAMEAANVPTEMTTSQTLAGAFDLLQKACRKLGPKVIPLRLLAAPVAAPSGLKVVLAPALGADVCLSL